MTSESRIDDQRLAVVRFGEFEKENALRSVVQYEQYREVGETLTDERS